MNTNLSEIIVIVDRSSSMDAMRGEAISGFNEFLDKQKASKDGECLLTYCQFNHEYEIIYNGVPIQDIPPLTEKTYVPSGMTALYDAVGRTIDEVGRRLVATPEEKRPGDITVVIITDGQENASKEYHQRQVQNRINHQTEKYQWSFMFLGQNLNAVAAGRAMGMSVNCDKHYMGQMRAGGQGQSVGYDVMSDGLLRKRAAFRSSETKTSVGFTQEDKQLFDSALADSTGDDQ
jgi:hypothetical protein